MPLRAVAWSHGREIDPAQASYSPATESVEFALDAVAVEQRQQETRHRQPPRVDGSLPLFALMKGGHLCITTPVGEGELVSPALVPARPRSSPIRERHGTTLADMSETLPQPFTEMPQREAHFSPRSSPERPTLATSVVPGIISPARADNPQAPTACTTRTWTTGKSGRSSGTLRKTILDTTYRPGRDRRVPIPKASGHGTRTLLIQSIIDRLVQRAIVQTVQPYLDPTFDEQSYGYRPGCDRQQALARAERLALSANTWVWLTEDLKDAFNQVPQRRLLDVVRHRLPNEGIVRLIEHVVLTDTGRGLRQGGCLSPLLLNLYLDHHLDRRWRMRHPDLSLLRVQTISLS